MILTCLPLGHPLDTIKVRLQTQKGLYTGAIDCFVKMVKTEGVYKGLFRGIASPMANMAFLNAVAFGLYEQCKKLSSHVNTRYFGNRESLRKYEPFVAGGLVGVVSSFFSTPFDVVKVRLQLDNVTDQKYRGTIHASRLLFREHGTSVFFLGTVVNLYREVIFAAAYFGVYETMKYHFDIYLKSKDVDLPQLVILLSGGFAGMMGWGFSFPLDVIKSVKQSQPVEGITWKNRGLSSMHIARDRIFTSGFAGFYKGVGPSLIRAFIVSSTRFSAYELVVTICNKLNI